MVVALPTSASTRCAHAGPRLGSGDAFFDSQRIAGRLAEEFCNEFIPTAQCQARHQLFQKRLAGYNFPRQQQRA